jgi:ABC-2 type transport system ATP-binding protein
MARAPRRRRADALLDRMDLAAARNRRVKGFSKGMTQRLGIANALVADPQVIFLDEPTDGLDPMGRREVRDLLIELRAAGKTVLLNSHLLGEVEQVCNRVAILIDGRVARTGAVGDLAPPQVRYWLDADDVGRLEAVVRPLAAAVSRPAEGHPGLLVDLAAREQVVGLIDAARAAGIAIYAASPMRLSLEEVFIQVVRASRKEAVS